MNDTQKLTAIVLSRIYAGSSKQERPVLVRLIRDLCSVYSQADTMHFKAIEFRNTVFCPGVFSFWKRVEYISATKSYEYEPTRSVSATCNGKKWNVERISMKNEKVLWVTLSRIQDKNKVLLDVTPEEITKVSDNELETFLFQI